MPKDQSRVNQLRMMTKVARLYHAKGMVQTDIAKALGISQARVSRLLSSAESERIVRTVVVPPNGLYSTIEEELASKYDLAQVHVVDASFETASQQVETLGEALATVIQSVAIDGLVIGFSSQSLILQSMVNNLQPFARSKAHKVVELLGGIGSPEQQHEASKALENFARLTGATPAYLRVPGITAIPAEGNKQLEFDPYTAESLDDLNKLDLAIYEVAAAQNSVKAAGQINLRQFDLNGQQIAMDSQTSITGLTLQQLKRTSRKIAVATGKTNHSSVLAALRGNLVTSLITDLETAEFLVKSK